MIDPHRVAVFVHDRRTGEFEDKTNKVVRYESQYASDLVRITYHDGRGYSYKRSNVWVLENPTRSVLAKDTRAEVRGTVWPSVFEVVTFAAPGAAWSRVFYQTQDGEDYRTFPADQVRVVRTAAKAGCPDEVLNYWQDIVDHLSEDDPLAHDYRRLDFIHPDSVLASYLTRRPIALRDLPASMIFPFRCNLSQRRAVEYALSRSISVIEGPPGTGKTETILNLIANIVRHEHLTVGVVSCTNTAVDNVRDKLVDLGFGHIIAGLGRREKKEEFFAAQDACHALLDAFLTRVPPHPDAEEFHRLDQRLRRLQDAERDRALWRSELDAYRLEQEHFQRHLRQDELPELTNLPLLRRSSDRILDYLAETELDHDGARPGLLRRIRRYLKYGSLKGLDPTDTSVALRLQQAFYDKQIAELDQKIRRVEEQLRGADFDRLAREHQHTSARFLHAELGERYRARPRKKYQLNDYRKGATFDAFMRDYPVLLSTCHALRSCLPNGYLLDYLIIDEASQVHPLLAGLVMSCCRNLVVVGDQRQLPPIPLEAAAKAKPPHPAYDCRRHSILSSLAELYGEDLPRTLLREHYRCDPAIIGFCNKKFYGGELIPYTSSGSEQAMLVHRTPEGNHMRRLREGGRFNQREIDAIKSELIPKYHQKFENSEIGIVTPYRRQADRAADVLDQHSVDTVHKFQGRQKKVVILSTVLDETRLGRQGLPFVDDPKLVNVAVSRAVQLFILVTNHEMMPRSRHIKELAGYIDYQNIYEGITDSAVISVFDLLYRKYSQRLRPLARRLKNEMEYKSEDIIWTTLHNILAEDRYAHLTVGHHVLLRNLLPDLTRLDARQQNFVRHRASLDFVTYNRVTNQPILAIEVDGFAYHENNPAQRTRDAIKDSILEAYQMPLLRLPTTGSGEEQRIRRALDAAEEHWRQMPPS